MTADRRAFLRRSSAALAAGALVGPEHAMAAEPAPGPEAPRTLDRGLLRSAGDAVLPESLTPQEREDAINAFELWLDGFEPVAERVHAYGGDVLRYGPPDPEPGWSAQLEALNRLANARYQAQFGDLDREVRRVLLEEHIEREADWFPDPLRARHVAVALMAHYFDSPIARDRCYGVSIDTRACRTTDRVGEKPPPLGS